jgi:hypothetical protein
VICTEQLPVLVRANGMVCVNKLTPLLDAGSAVEFVLPLLEMLMSRPETVKAVQLLVRGQVSHRLGYSSLQLVFA